MAAFCYNTRMVAIEECEIHNGRGNKLRFACSKHRTMKYQEIPDSLERGKCSYTQFT